MMRPPVWDLQLRPKVLERGSNLNQLPTININANLFQLVKKQVEMTPAHVAAGKNIKSVVGLPKKLPER